MATREPAEEEVKDRQKGRRLGRHRTLGRSMCQSTRRRATATSTNSSAAVTATDRHRPQNDPSSTVMTLSRLRAARFSNYYLITLYPVTTTYRGKTSSAGVESSQVVSCRVASSTDGGQEEERQKSIEDCNSMTDGD